MEDGGVIVAWEKIGNIRGPQGSDANIPLATYFTPGAVMPGYGLNISKDGTLSASRSEIFLMTHPVGSVMFFSETQNGVTSPASFGGQWQELPSLGPSAWVRIS